MFLQVIELCKTCTDLDELAQKACEVDIEICTEADDDNKDVEVQRDIKLVITIGDAHC